jgi:hypothetical protein
MHAPGCEARQGLKDPGALNVNSRLTGAVNPEDLSPMSHVLPTELPIPLLERLRAEGIATLEAWVALGRRRRQIFGVTRAAVEQLDALAKAAAIPKP